MSEGDRTLYDAIYRGIWYHGRRTILGMSADGANQAAHPGAAWQAHHNYYRRRRYQRLRAQGMTSYEVKAIMRGQTPERVQAEHIQQNRAYRAKWGGDPSKQGSQAWQRRVLAGPIIDLTSPEERAMLEAEREEKNRREYQEALKHLTPDERIAFEAASATFTMVRR